MAELGCCRIIFVSIFVLYLKLSSFDVSAFLVVATDYLKLGSIVSDLTRPVTTRPLFVRRVTRAQHPKGPIKTSGNLKELLAALNTISCIRLSGIRPFIH